MAFFRQLAFSALAFSAFAVAAPVDVGVAQLYDVLVVGGGPAGLSAASGLARVRRNVLLLDSAVYRNQDTRHIHDLIGNDGTAPAIFRATAREQIAKYDTVKMKNATVISIVSTGTDNATSFVATDSDGLTYAARKIILGTGMKDLLPSTPGLQDAWSRGIFWCPWCDGYEHRDQPFGILGSLTDAVGSVIEMATLNRDIIAFVNGTDTKESWDILDVKRPGWRQQLAGYGVQIQNATIDSIDRLLDGAAVFNASTGGPQGTEFDIFQVNLADGQSIQRGAFMTNFPSEQRSDIGAKLGLKVVSDKLVVDVANMKSSVAGVYAVGDANSDGATNVPHAMFSGKKAAVFAHVQLEKEFAATFVTGNLTRRGLNLDEAHISSLMGRDLEALWEGIKSL